jgi:hypothetical protein
MKQWFKIPSILLLLGSSIWSCEKANENLTVGPAATEKAKTSSDLPATVALEQPYPNPFQRNPGGEIRIRFGLPQTLFVHLTVENAVGDVVNILVNAQLPAGVHEVHWDTKNNNGKLVKAGVYMVHLNTSTASLRKLLEIKD